LDNCKYINTENNIYELLSVRSLDLVCRAEPLITHSVRDSI